MSDAPSPLTPTAVAPFLRATLASLTAEVDALSASALAWHPAPGEWCVNEVLGHLIETERRGGGGCQRSRRVTHRRFPPAGILRYPRRRCQTPSRGDG